MEGGHIKQTKPLGLSQLGEHQQNISRQRDLGLKFRQNTFQPSICRRELNKVNCNSGKNYFAPRNLERDRKSELLLDLHSLFNQIKLHILIYFWSSLNAFKYLSKVMKDQSKDNIPATKETGVSPQVHDSYPLDQVSMPPKEKPG